MTDPASYKRTYLMTSGITNGMVEAGDKPFTVNRPIFYTDTDASAEGAGSKGRGIYQWRAATESLANEYTYSVIDTTVYWSSALTACTGSTLAAGSEKVYMFEVGSNLVIIDPAGNAGYYITLAAPTVVNTITDTDFPPNQLPALQLARGGDALKGRAYVMDRDGTIWNSALEDPTTWSGGDNINAEMKGDRGVNLQRLENEFAAMGEESIEYFYHAGNPTNSPLSVRQDVFHDIGCYNLDTATRIGKSLYFVGQSTGGGVSVYRLIGHAVQRISRPDLDAYLTSVCADRQGFSLLIYGGGLTIQGREYYFLSLDYTTAMETYVFDSLVNEWYKWDYDEESIDGIPIVDSTFYWDHTNDGTTSRSILANGDIITTEAKYRMVSYPSDGNMPVQFQILTGNQNFESGKYKFMSGVSLDAFVTHAEQETTSQVAQLRFYDEGEVDSAGLPTHDIELLNREVAGAGESNILAWAGRFKQRNIEVTIPTDATISRTEVYALDFALRAGL